MKSSACSSRWLFLALATSLSPACSNNPSAQDSGADSGNLPSDTPSTIDSTTPTDASTLDTSNPVDASEDSSTTDAGTCTPTSRFAAPTVTFTLPRPTGRDLYYPNVQTSFPNVDWTRLERLYIPAGTYRLINIGNLPQRTLAQPLVITNQGGQVKLEAEPAAGYIVSITGGSGWILTGRYDPIGRTGDVNFQGHACGRYANSHGTYGIESDGRFASGGHMGIGITGATNFELEYLEIWRSGFAGLRINGARNPDNSFTNITDVEIHDTYVHDTKSEGYYIGWTGAAPSPLISGLHIHDNRILRTGTEALQVQNLGDRTEIDHNIVAWGAIDWRAAFQDFQNNNAQSNVRRGTVNFHHNVFMGGAGGLQSFFVANESGDGNRTVRFEDNYFADTLWLSVYLGGTTAAGSTYTFNNNVFRGLGSGYREVYPTETEATEVIRVGGQFTSPITLSNNRWEGTHRLVAGLTNGNGTVGSVTGTNNVNGTVDTIQFRDAGRPSQSPTRTLEMWTATATRHPQNVPVTYAPGTLVMHDGVLYECLQTSTNQVPSSNPAQWRALPFPTDDVRLAPNSTYATRGIGLR